MALDIIELASADATWPGRFAIEAAAIRDALGSASEGFVIEHVGSTAVPGLASKPVIDILIIPQNDALPLNALVSAMPKLGYLFWAEDPDPQHMFFVKGMPPNGTGRTHHVHVYPRARAMPVIAFRDYLRSHPGTAGEYEALKRDLAAKSSGDREAYTRGKDAFVARILGYAVSQAPNAV
jgi:GrpB-like predicted nucleotidyltransferase (UPF0157 family)